MLGGIAPRRSFPDKSSFFNLRSVPLPLWLMTFGIVPESMLLDKSIWSKLQSPAHLMAMLVAAWPGWGVRACFFSLTLLCLLPEL